MPAYYSISAAVVRTDPDTGTITSRQIPTFLLRTSTLGIVDEAHAERIAADVISYWEADDTRVYVTAVAELS